MPQIITPQQNIKSEGGREREREGGREREREGGGSSNTKITTTHIVYLLVV
jgi:hypothetical protein